MSFGRLDMSHVTFFSSERFPEGTGTPLANALFGMRPPCPVALPSLLSGMFPPPPLPVYPALCPVSLASCPSLPFRCALSSSASCPSLPPLLPVSFPTPHPALLRPNPVPFLSPHSVPPHPRLLPIPAPSSRGPLAVVNGGRRAK